MAQPSRTMYQIYALGDDAGLMPLARTDGRDPKDAVKRLLSAAEDNNVTPQASRFLVVPVRNMTEISVEIQTETKVVFK